MGIHSRHNNFDALRFFAALAVLWSHAFPLTTGSEAREPLFALSGGQTTLGTIAVAFFFTISGYLITRSFEHTPSPWRFAAARTLRIMPALLVVLLLTSFVIGPLVTTLDVSDYFASSDVYRYVLLQGSFVRHFDELPGVFALNPEPWVNGSLWTLRYEVACYALVFLLGVAGILNRWVTLSLYAACVVGMAIADQGHISDGHALPHTSNLFDLGSKFLAGALIYQWQVPLKANLAWLALSVAVACLFLGNFQTAQRTVIPYVALFLALGTTLRMPNMARFGDLSYGLYIYAWPVKQLIVMHSAHPTWYGVAALATPIVLLLALASWHTIEKVALALKDEPRLWALPDWPEPLIATEPAAAPAVQPSAGHGETAMQSRHARRNRDATNP